MNSRIGIFVSTALILLSVFLWSVTVLADERQDSRAAAHDEARQSASLAHREAAASAVTRLRASSRVDLDVELADRTSGKVSAD